MTLRTYFRDILIAFTNLVERNKHFVQLSQLARHFLSVLSTTITSEMLLKFSLQEVFMVESVRNLLAPELVENGHMS